jgi:hypothetical protein
MRKVERRRIFKPRLCGIDALNIFTLAGPCAQSLKQETRLAKAKLFQKEVDANMSGALCCFQFV